MDKTQRIKVENDTKRFDKCKNCDVYFDTENCKALYNSRSTNFFDLSTSMECRKNMLLATKEKVKQIREKQLKLNYDLKKSLKVDIEKSRKILKSLVMITLSEPKSKVLMEIKDIIENIIDDYFSNPYVVMHLAYVSVHDYSTQLHLINVMLLCIGYAYYNKLGKENMKLYGLIGLLHDVGKVEIPDYLLQTPRKLTVEEFKEIKKHPLVSKKLLKNSKVHAMVIVAAQEHHERLDGSGYPNGKKAKDLNETSRILAIIDIFEALTTWRPYKDSSSPFKALQIIRTEVVAKKLDFGLFKRFAYSIIGMTSM